MWCLCLHMSVSTGLIPWSGCGLTDFIIQFALTLFPKSELLSPYWVFLMWLCHILLWGSTHWGQGWLTAPDGVGHKCIYGRDPCQKIEIQNNSIKSTFVKRQSWVNRQISVWGKQNRLFSQEQVEGFRCDKQTQIQSCKKGLLVALKKRRCGWVSWILIIGSITVVISSLPMPVVLLIRYFFFLKEWNCTACHLNKKNQLRAVCKSCKVSLDK